MQSIAQNARSYKNSGTPGKDTAFLRRRKVQMEIHLLYQNWENIILTDCILLPHPLFLNGIYRQKFGLSRQILFRVLHAVPASPIEEAPHKTVHIILLLTFPQFPSLPTPRQPTASPGGCVFSVPQKIPAGPRRIPLPERRS